MNTGEMFMSIVYAICIAYLDHVYCIGGRDDADFNRKLDMFVLCSTLEWFIDNYLVSNLLFKKYP